MTAATQQRTRRSGERTSRVAARWRAGVLLALLALLAQATLPQLHAWQTGGQPASVAALDAETAGRVALGAAAAADSATEHGESHCSICQTIAQARSFLIVSAVLPQPLRAWLDEVDPPAERYASARPAQHAPRGPPSAA